MNKEPGTQGLIHRPTIFAALVEDGFEECEAELIVDDLVDSFDTTDRRRMPSRISYEEKLFARGWLSLTHPDMKLHPLVSGLEDRLFPGNKLLKAVASQEDINSERKLSPHEYFRAQANAMQFVIDSIADLSKK